MNKTLIALALFGVVGSASATVICPDGTKPGDHYNNDCHAAIKPLPPTIIKGGNPVTNNNTLGQQQQQAQLQAQRAEADAKAAAAARSESDATATGVGVGTGGNAAGGAASSEANGNGLNGNIALTGGSTNTTIRSTIIPPFVPSVTAPLPSAAIATVQGQCGGQVMSIMREIVGREAHIYKDTTEFHFGYSEVIRPLTDSNGKPTPFDTESMPGYVLGHQFTIVTGQAQVSIENSGALTVIAKSVGLGGGASGGGQLSQPMSAVSIQPCVLASPKEPVAFTMPPQKVVTEIMYVDRPASKPRHTGPRKPKLTCKPGEKLAA